MRRIKQKFSMDKALGHLTIVFALYALGAFNVKEVRAQAGCLTQCGGFGCECPPDPIPPKLSAQCFIEYREELLECPCGGANCSFDGPPTYQQHVESCERVCPSTLRTPCGARAGAPRITSGTTWASKTVPVERNVARQRYGTQSTTALLGLGIG